MTQPKFEPLMMESEAAEYLNLSPRTLAGWRYRGGGPRYVSVSATAVRYRRADLDEWIENRVRCSTSDPGSGEGSSPGSGGSASEASPGEE